MRNNSFILTSLISLLTYATIGATSSLGNLPDSIVALSKQAVKETFNNPVAAISHIDQIIAWADNTHHTSTLFRAYRTKGYIYEQNNNFEQAASAYSTALSLQPMVDDSAKMDILLDWAILNKKRGDYNTAKDYYQQALSIAEKTHNFAVQGYAYNGLATLHGALSDFEKAIEYNLKALEVVEHRGKKNDISMSFQNIAIVYMKTHNYDLAIKNVEQAYLMALEIPDSTAIATSLETHGKILNAMGNPTAALLKDQEALSIMEQVGDKRLIAALLVQIGDSYTQLNQLDKAEASYKRCLKYEPFLSYYEHPNFYYKWGNLSLKTYQTERALAAFTLSLELAQKAQLKDLIQKNNAALAEVYQQMGDVTKAFSYLKKASAYSDTLFNEANTRHITEAQFKYNVAQGEYNIALREKQIQALQLSQGRFWFGASLVVFLLITAWLIYFVRAKAKNNKILLQKNSEIQVQNQRLKDSNEILHQFAYASAHDLKEPLRSIGSFTNIISRRYSALLPPEAGEYMNFITGGVKRMESLLSGLLEYSTIISEEHIATKAFNIKRVLEDVVKNLNSKIVEKSALIEYNNCDISLFVSRLHLTQLFQNLMGNALKFSSETPKISINCSVQKDTVLLSIKDNGIGIKQEHGDKIFKLFQRLSRAPEYEGTGIGLTICKNIVEKHNGKLWFESKEGQGTTFFIALPMDLVQQNVQNTEGVLVNKKEVLQLA